MNESYVSEVNGELILYLINHMAYINKEKITISNVYGELTDMTLNRNEMSEITAFIKNVYPTNSTLDLNKKTFEINPNWVIIKSEDKQVEIRPEMFIKIVNCFEESEERLMNESNLTQKIFNELTKSNNNQSNGKTSERLGKIIATNSTQPKTNKSVYDNVVDTINKSNLGGNENGK